MDIARQVPLYNRTKQYLVFGKQSLVQSPPTYQTASAGFRSGNRWVRERVGSQSPVPFGQRRISFWQQMGQGESGEPVSSPLRPVPYFVLTTDGSGRGWGASLQSPSASGQ